MKTVTKILIAVCAVVLIAAVIIGVAVARLKVNVPELDNQKKLENPINTAYTYVVSQPPYSDRWVFDTPIGLKNYWIENRKSGNGLEIVLQQTKDGELVMLSDALPALSNADDLYGKDAAVENLTLEELKQVNLAYDFLDEDGVQIYVGLSQAQLTQVTVMTCEELLETLSMPTYTTAKVYLRFYDESKITDLEAALQKINDAAAANLLGDMIVFCPQSDAAADAADKACPDLARAATSDEAKTLVRECLNGKTPDALPYSVIFEKVNAQIGSEKFIHYARNLGLAVILSGVHENDVLKYRDYGVTGIATSDAPTFTQILTDARTAERESKKAAD